MKKEPLHKSLQNAENMLNEAYPCGINNEEYFSVLFLLYEHFSDRNLADLISNISGKDITLVVNDIYSSVSTKKPEITTIELVKAKLKRYGFSSVCTNE